MTKRGTCESTDYQQSQKLEKGVSNGRRKLEGKRGWRQDAMTPQPKTEEAAGQELEQGRREHNKLVQGETKWEKGDENRARRRLKVTLTSTNKGKRESPKTAQLG